jgi:phage terminase small subunit
MHPQGQEKRVAGGLTRSPLVHRNGRKSHNGDMRRRFIVEYLIDRNGTQAAIRAGYSARTAAAQASRLLKDVKVQEAVERGEAKVVAELENRYAISRERIACELAALGFSSMADYVSFTPAGEPFLDLSHSSSEQMSAIQELTIEDFKDGSANKVRRVKIKIYDRRAALVDLAKLMGYMREQQEERPLESAVIELVTSIARRGSPLPIGQSDRWAHSGSSASLSHETDST